MKKFVLSVVIFVMFASLFGTLFGCGKPKADTQIEISDIRYFNFRYQVGNYSEGTKVFRLEYADGVYTASCKPLTKPIEEAYTAEVDETFVRELEALLKDLEVNKWNGFRKYDKNTLDGRSFDLHIICGESYPDEYDKAKRIEADGYEKWPDNYTEVRDAIEAFFAKHLQLTEDQLNGI